MDIFVDTNIILDFLLKRESNTALFISCEKRGFSLFTSILSYNTIYYVLFNNTLKGTNKKARHTVIATQLKELKKFMKPIPTSVDDFNVSLESGFVDFKDALQHYTAINNNMDCIITRNKIDFAKSAIPVYTPLEFFNSFQL